MVSYWAFAVAVQLGSLHVPAAWMSARFGANLALLVWPLPFMTPLVRQLSASDLG